MSFALFKTCSQPHSQPHESARLHGGRRRSAVNVSTYEYDSCTRASTDRIALCQQWDRRTGNCNVATVQLMPSSPPCS